jgi:hypothetical protein
MPIKIFLSYSHRDEDIKNELDIHFAPLKRSGKAQTWSDRDIELSSEWDEDIKRELEEADIILLLISANFIASNYIWDNELKRAMERHEAKTARVIPIFAKKCEFQNMPFAKLQGLPKNAKPIATFADRDEAYTEIVAAIRRLIDTANFTVREGNVETEMPENQDARSLIAKGEIKKGIEAMKKTRPNDNTLTLLEGRLSRLEKEQQQGTISHDNAKIERNQIMNSLLSLLE